MNKVERPRVVIIGLDESKVESIAGLCGDLRVFPSLDSYLKEYSWSETDLAVLGGQTIHKVGPGVHVLTVGVTGFQWSNHPEPGVSGEPVVGLSPSNTEREVAIASNCPPIYEALAADLARRLNRSDDPPPTAKFDLPRDEQTALIETTSKDAAAIRFVLANQRPWRSSYRPSLQQRGRSVHPTQPTWLPDDRCPSPIALMLPEVDNLSAWFRAFLTDIHELDPERVPNRPPRLANLTDWYTPDESALAGQIEETRTKIQELETEQETLETKLSAETEKADSGIRRAIWEDGDPLVDAVTEILTDLGFNVRDMDAERSDGEPKHEDLRLTLDSHPGWEAIVEVKGYTSGTRTNDARQITEHSKHYIKENLREPDLTLWIGNPHRTAVDPAARPVPDNHVRESASNIHAVYVLASDLYLQWARVARGEADAADVTQSLIDAEPGIWVPSTPD